MKIFGPAETKRVNANEAIALQTDVLKSTQPDAILEGAKTYQIQHELKELSLLP